MQIGGDEIYSSLADIFASAGRKPRVFKARAVFYCGVNSFSVNSRLTFFANLKG